MIRVVKTADLRRINFALSHRDLHGSKQVNEVSVVDKPVHRLSAASQDFVGSLQTRFRIH